VKITRLSLVPLALCFFLATFLQAEEEAQEQTVSVSRLTSLLKSSDTSERERAAEALGKLGSAAEPAIPALRRNLSDDFPYVRIRSAEALAQIGAAAIPAFVEALRNDNKEVRLVAVQALANLGEKAKPAIPPLVIALQDSETAIRQHAANALENCGADAAPVLMKALRDPNFQNRAGLVRVLGALDGTPATLPDQLIPLLADPNSDLRLAAVKALTRKGQASISALVLALASEKTMVRAESAAILADIGPDASESVPALTNLLKDENAHVRAEAAHALGKMQEAAVPAIPALRVALNDSDADVAARAQEALTAITVTSGGPRKSSVGIEAASPKSSGNQGVAVKAKAVAKRPIKRATRRVAKTAIPEVPAFSYLKLDSTASIQALAMTAKNGTSENKAAALSILASLLQNPDEKIQALVVAALEWVGSDDAKKILDPYLKQVELKKIKRLMNEIETSTGPVTSQIDALAAMGPVVVPAATRALQSQKPGVRVAGATILMKLGSAAASAVPQLIQTLDDKVPAVRSQAAEALEKISNPTARNPLRWFYLKEKIRPYLEMLHISI
jgi:HEAT repeat protein